MNDQPTVLYVTNEVPWRATNGGQRRELELIERLRHSWNVVLVVVSVRPDVDRADGRCMIDAGGVAECVVLVAQPEMAPLAYTDRERSHFSSELYTTLLKLVRRYEPEVIHFEGYFMSLSSGRIADHVPTVLVEENLEYVIERQRAEFTHTPHLSLLGVEEREAGEWKRAAAVGAVCDEDAAEMSAHGTTPDVVASGCDHIPFISPGRADIRKAPRFFFMAGTDWWPTADALRCLLHDVWPAVRVRFPDATLAITGGGPKQDGGDGVHYTGFVEDLPALLAECDALLAPLRAGGGTKLKCLESLAAGRPVFSTRIGVYGLSDEALDACVVVDSVHEMASAVIDVVASRARWQELRGAAIEVRQVLPTWEESALRQHAMWARCRPGRAAVPNIASRTTTM